ncbi:MAG: diguanylate cyclase, partial [Desulfobacterales bacterium]|nr:diguanylate cyclase [Desulfobacterales bacterium]
LSDSPPDLILLDVMMPGIDGYEVCKRLKANPTTLDIPVIFITAKIDEPDEVKGFQAGAVDYVTKPFRPVVVEARVKTHVDLKIKSELLKNHSLLDGLTGVPNRRRFNEYIETVWNLAVRECSPVSLILIDIDHFKLFNDNYGHQEGDACLIRVAKCLARALQRKTDIVARYGGEEFGCILPKTNLEGAVLIAQKFHNEILSLQISHLHSPTHSFVSISQGVATLIPAKNVLKETLLKMADQALYKAKTIGRNTFCTS